MSNDGQEDQETEAQTGKQRQKKWRLKNQQGGKTEVRGLFAPKALHARIKAYGLRIQKQLENKTKPGRKKPTDKKQ